MGAAAADEDGILVTVSCGSLVHSLFRGEPKTALTNNKYKILQWFHSRRICRPPAVGATAAEEEAFHVDFLSRPGSLSVPILVFAGDLLITNSAFIVCLSLGQKGCVNKRH